MDDSDIYSALNTSPHSDLLVLKPNFSKVCEAITVAIDRYHCGEQPTPIFLVSPQTNVDAAHAEALALGIPDNVGILLRTSGSTTGTGKIVALTWKALMASASATHAAFGEPGTWMANLPLNHIAGLQTIIRSVLAGRTPIDLATTALTDALSTPGPHYMSVVPLQLMRLLDSPDLALLSAHKVKILVGGAHTDPTLLDQAQAAGLDVVTSYGMTETCGGCVYDGKPIGDTQISLDSSRIVISGSVLAHGYLGAQPFHGRHETADLGRLSNGCLHVLGRVDDAITTGGLTIIPRLIEDCYARLAARIVVVPLPSLQWGQEAVAVSEKPVEELRDAVKGELEKGWAPRRNVTLRQLGLQTWPCLDSGKIDRRGLARCVREYFMK